MNSVFTRDFFRIARSRLQPGGIFAQWFHIYNMPEDDLKSLLAGFSDVFPDATLWKLNDGDVLLTGVVPGGGPPSSPLTLAAMTDLLSVGVANPAYLLDLHMLNGADIARFASGAPPNSDDFPVLEFHGQRDLHAQTDVANDAALTAASHSPPPDAVARVREQIGAPERLAIAQIFEKAGSLRTSYRNYARARELDSGSLEAIAGMDRCANLPERRPGADRRLDDRVQADHRPGHTRPG